MKYGMTGSRKGMSHEQYQKFFTLLERYPKLCHLIHGDCHGADTEAHMLAAEKGHEITIRPCDFPGARARSWAATIHEEKRPLVRNHDIVDESEMMFAFPDGWVEQWRGSGTWATIRYAKKVKKMLWIIYPDGSVASHV